MITGMGGVGAGRWTMARMTESDVEAQIQDPELRRRVERYLAEPVTHVLGNPEAGICVVEFGDFECPYCAGAAPVLRELVEQSEGRVRLMFRNFPLFEVHPHALTAALAAESVAASAGEQAYWTMHDKLFVHQARLTDVDLALYATSLGGDPALASGSGAQRFAPIVQADYAAGIEVAALRRATGLSADSGRTEPRRRPWQRR
jgi:protein-disulfide isomerase